MPIPYIPASAPFTAEQRAWLNGYFAGLFADANLGEDLAGQAASTAPAKPLLVMYGSQTGSAERLAKHLGKEAGKHGFAARVIEANAYASVNLTKESHLAILTSTWGDGDATDNAAAFWSFINSDQAPRLENLSYSVLALGDKNYSDFCGAGRKFDERIDKLGGKRVHPRADCDTDYEAAAKAWTEAVLPAMQTISGSAAATLDTIAGPKTETAVPAPAVDAKPAGHSRNNPFPARLITNRTLNKSGSAKDTRHFEISLEGSGLSYEVDDALGVMPANCPALVNEILAALGCDGEEAVKDPSGTETSLRHALHACYAVAQSPSSFVQAVAERGGDTGHKAFARDLGVLVRPEEMLKVTSALVRVYIANGNRGDRKKARLKHLLETWTLDQYLAETEKLLGYQLLRAPLDAAGKSPLEDERALHAVPHSHIGLVRAKVKVAGESVEGYHVFVGGGFGKSQAVGRQMFQGVYFESLKPTLEKMLHGYLKHRQPGEGFQTFTNRHDLGKLQEIFSNEE